MHSKTKQALSAAGAAVLLAAVVSLAILDHTENPGRATAAPEEPGPIARYPDRTAYYGDLHLHTAISYDAYTLFGTRVGPEDAYRFASGETVTFIGQPVKRRWPLDFMAVTDHAENMGFANAVGAANGALGGKALYDATVRGGIDAYRALYAYLRGHTTPDDLKAQQKIFEDTWAREVDAANRFYRPGKFTTFAGYEYTDSKDGANLHRNVIFRDQSRLPFSVLDSKDPKDLWTYLQTLRREGVEALAIPHNSNASNGLMFDWTTLDGRPIDRAYAQLRVENEPLMEISQGKGQSETHPELSASDEFSNFEVFDQLLSSPTKSKPGGSYARDALGRGMLLEQKLGVNPYKLGFVGGSDLHGALSVSDQRDYWGNNGSANLGGGRPTELQAKSALGQATDPAAWDGFPRLITTTGSLTAVWAESNTRQDIYAALRRRETFATSGSRIRVRVFGGWSLPGDLLHRPDWVHTAYRLGVPMGSDLPAMPQLALRPRLAIQAAKDPDGANLDRIQVIKVWIANGQQHERVFDAAWSGARKPDDRTGKVPSVGNTVDLKTGAYANSIGAPELQTLWTDPTFTPGEQCAYYVRVLEIPTPRWSTLLAIERKLPFPTTEPLSEEQRAWTSPIWYTPALTR